MGDVKQLTFDGRKIDLDDVREHRNRRVGPSNPDTIMPCALCGLNAKQVKTNEENGFTDYNCYCVCHNNPPKQERTKTKFFNAGVGVDNAEKEEDEDS